MPAHVLGPAAAGRRIPASFAWWRRLRDLLARRAAAIGGGLFSMRLAARQHLQLRDAAGWTVVCRSGSLWITQEADVNDIFLKDGEGFLLDRRGLILVSARRDSMLSLRPPSRRGNRHVLTRSGTRTGAEPADVPAFTWLRALYPESGPWNDPDVYRRSGLL